MNDPSPATQVLGQPGLSPRRLAGFAALALPALVLLVYLPSLPGGFVWDDMFLVDQNPIVKGQFNLRTIWFSTDFPLSNVALWVEWLAFGKSAAGYRVVNLLLHASSCVLLWRLLLRLRIPGAWLAAALFAVHPVAAGSVAWISEIKNTLSLPFYLLSFIFYLDFAECQKLGNEAAARAKYGLSLAAFLLALLAKTTTVVLPVLLLGTAVWRERQMTLRALVRTAPFFVLGLALGLLTVWFQTQQTLANFALPAMSFTARLAGAGRAIWFYLGKALWPLRLNANYPRWEIHPEHWLEWLPILALVVVAGISWKFRRSWGRHVLFGLVVFSASLFPALGFFDMYFLVFSRVSDHFAYLALLVPLTAIGVLAATLGRGLLLRVIALPLLLGFGLLGAQRARVFSTDESLWRDTLSKNESAWSAHNNLACILAERNDLGPAAEHFAASLRLNPNNASAHCNLGKIALLRQDLTGAEVHFKAALALRANHLDTLKSYGALLAQQGRVAEALEKLSNALQVRAEAETRLQLAPLLSGLGRDAEAVENLRAVLKAEPNSTAALQNLAWILATSPDEKIRNGPQAVQCAERASQLVGGPDPQMLATVAAAYAEVGRFDLAISNAEQTVKLARAAGNPGFAQMNEQLLRWYRTGRPYRSSAPNSRQP